MIVTLDKIDDVVFDLHPGDRIFLRGNLGAGKTTFARKLIQKYLGNSEAQITSPTYTYYQKYGENLYHFDLYRFSDPEEWFDAGFDEYFSVPQVSFIEWAEKAQGLIPQIDWQITISFKHNLRELIIDSLTLTGDTCLTKLINRGVI